MSTTKQTVIVAADGGGTGCRACAGTLERGILAEARGGPGNVHSNFDTALANLIGTISAALAKAGLGNVPPEEITAHLGVAGAHSDVEIAAVKAALPYGQSSVTGDRATSVRGVLGEADGFVIALGTGTIVARQKNLTMKTIGGWGFNLSDQASGAWLGRRLLEEVIHAEDGMRQHTPLSQRTLDAKGGLVGIVIFGGSATPGDYAPMARDVITAASAGDALGCALMAEGAAYLETGLSTLGFVPGDILSLAGGVGPHYGDHLPPSLTRNLQEPKGSALDGAFAMAAQSARESL
jgi:glucosamine kinase